MAMRCRMGLRLLSCAALLLTAACQARHYGGGDMETETVRDAGGVLPTRDAGSVPRQERWAAIIAEASRRFDVPELWIRQVMWQESRGEAYRDGAPVTSAAGAMGLMQVMPQTYETMRVRYHLGADPYDPRNNILAGTAYMREMYDAYGAPGFLAAYNAGPARLDGLLQRNIALPEETQRYLAGIAPAIAGAAPHRSRLAGDRPLNWRRAGVSYAADTAREIPAIPNLEGE